MRMGFSMGGLRVWCWRARVWLRRRGGNGNVGVGYGRTRWRGSETVNCCRVEGCGDGGESGYVGRDSMKKYDSYVARARVKHGEKFSEVGLNPSFRMAYNHGERVTVLFCNAEGIEYERKRGTIVVTTGWIPCFLLMLTSRSRGSSWTIGPCDRIIS